MQQRKPRPDGGKEDATASIHAPRSQRGWPAVAQGTGCEIRRERGWVQSSQVGSSLLDDFKQQRQTKVKTAPSWRSVHAAHHLPGKSPQEQPAGTCSAASKSASAPSGRRRPTILQQQRWWCAAKHSDRPAYVSTARSRTTVRLGRAPPLGHHFGQVGTPAAAGGRGGALAAGPPHKTTRPQRARRLPSSSPYSTHSNST